MEPILQNDWVLWYLFLCFIFRNLNDPNYASFITFQSILHDPAIVFSIFQYLLKFKTGHLNSWREPILEKGWIIWSPFLYFNFKNFKDPSSCSFITFQCILHDPVVLFSAFQSFSSLRGAIKFLEGDQSCRTAQLLPPPFYILAVRIWRAQILHLSLDFQSVWHDTAIFLSVFQIFLKLKGGA